MKALSSVMGTLLVLAVTIALGGLMYAYSQGLFGALTKTNNVPVNVNIYPNGNSNFLVNINIQNTGNQVMTISSITVYHQGSVVGAWGGSWQIPAGESSSQVFTVNYNNGAPQITPGQQYTVIVSGMIGNQPWQYVTTVTASG